MSAAPALSRLGPVVARKRAERQDRSLNLLGHRDALIGPMLRGILAQAKRSGAISEATVAYLNRKQHGVRADYYRLRYGRDYATGLGGGARRISTFFAAAYRSGWDAELSGSPSTSSPPVHTRGAALAYYERGRRDALHSVTAEES
jgi:hypothetical protein